MGDDFIKRQLEEEQRSLRQQAAEEGMSAWQLDNSRQGAGRMGQSTPRPGTATQSRPAENAQSTAARPQTYEYTKEQTHTYEYRQPESQTATRGTKNWKNLSTPQPVPANNRGVGFVISIVVVIAFIVINVFLSMDEAAEPETPVPPTSQPAGTVYDPAEYSAGLGEELANVFFSYQVNDVKTASQFNGALPEDGYQYLIINVTVKNVSGQTIPMSMFDFELDWGYDGYAYSEDPVTEAQLPTEWEMEADDVTQGDLVFQAPADQTDFSLSYLEVYEDGTEGDYYYIDFQISPPVVAA